MKFTTRRNFGMKIIQICVILIHFKTCLTEDVTGFEVAVGGTNLVKLEDGGTATIDLVYEDGGTSGLTFEAAIDTGTSFDTTGASKNELEKTISYVVNPNFFASDGFGTYLLTFTLTPSSGNAGTKEVVVFYEEPIVGFSINRYPYLPLNEEVFFDTTFTSGSNVETEWFLDTNDTCLLKHPGQPRNLRLNFTFTVPGTHNVTTVAANTVTRTFDSMLVYAHYRLNGFNITKLTTPVGTTQFENFTLTLTTTADQPMGTLKVNASYGDGTEETIELNSLITNMQGNGHIIQHMYTTQGNYTAEFVIYSEIDTMNFTLDVYVWDKVAVTLESKYIAKVHEDITFQFVTPPPTGFQYIIDYGDGTIKQNDVSAWFSTYNEPQLTHGYSNEGMYNVTMTAWNMFYAAVTTYMMTIQYPIPDVNITLKPETDKIPIPNGIMEFVMLLEQDNPSPTNVTCSFDFQDSQDLDVSTNIVYNVPVNKIYTYVSNGTRTVTFICWNLVSNMTKTSTVEIVSFVEEDFTIEYQSPVHMNTTLSEELDDRYPKTSNIMKVYHNPINHTFYVGLLGCSKLPPDIYFTWMFGDKPTPERGLVQFEKGHTYTERGTFTVSVVIENNRTGRVYNKPTTTIVIGVVQFSVTPQRGEISKTDFSFSFDGMEGAVTYTFDPDADNPVTLSTPAIIRKYNSWGLFQPFVLAENGTLSEIVYLPEAVEADYYIDGELSISVSNGTHNQPPGSFQINLPPGNVTVTVSITGTVSKPYINCSINLGDLINKETFIRYGNITTTKSLVLDTVYYTLGNHSLTINCSNFVSSHYAEYHVDVFNECFTKDGIFDRQYSNYKSPMKVYTSVDTDLSSRMGVKCIGKEAGFDWTVQRIQLENETENRTPLSYDPPNQPLKGTVRFQRGKISEGLVFVTLNVSLDGTWIHEFIYLQFIKPPPYAYIVGGNKKSAKYLDQILTLDALTGSYDSEKGIGGNANLIFEWNCSMLSASDLADLQIKFERGDTSIRQCTLEDVSRGITNLNFSMGTQNQGYVASVNVSDGLLVSNFTQMIKVTPGDPPSMTIICRINCREKVATSSPIVMRANCSDCRFNLEKVTYSWSLSIYDPAIIEDNKYRPVLDFESKTSTGVNQASMVINADTLIKGKKYALQLEVSSDIRNGSTKLVVDILTNLPPQQGTRGKCTTDQDVYEIPTDKVMVKCENFADEGGLLDQDYERDLKQNEPLTYLYETKTSRLNSANEAEVIVAELYKGGESTVINMPVQMGDPAFNYTVEMRILIFDRFGDNVLYSLNITVKPQASAIPTNSSDTSGLEVMFNSFDQTMNFTNAGGNDMAVVRLCGSLASVFTPVENGSVEVETSEDDILNDGATEVNTGKEESPVQKVLTQKTTELAKIISNAVLRSDGETKQISASDAQQVSRSIEALFKNPEYVSEDTVFEGAKVCAGIIDNIWNITRHVKPFPVEDLKSMEGTIDGSIATVDKILNNVIPSSVVDIKEEITEDSIYDELIEREKENIQILSESNNSTEEELVISEDRMEELREKAKLLLKLRQYKQEVMIAKAKSAENSMPYLMNAIGSAYTMKLATTEIGAGPSTVEKTNLELQVEKVTAELLLNRTEEPIRGIRLSFPRSEINDTALDEPIEIKQTVFDRPPQIYGDDVASLTSKAIQVDISNKDIVPEISLPNAKQSYARRYDPQMTPGDPDQMFYISFIVPNDDDVAIAYLKPDDFDINNKENLTLYEVFFRETYFPKVSLHDFRYMFGVRDWVEEYGFKVMMPRMSKGKHYLGIKPYKVPTFTSSKKRRKKRSAASLGNTTTLDPLTTTESVDNSTFQPIDANFSLIIMTTGCRSYSESEKKWVSKGCVVLPMSNLNETICRCPQAPGNVFATTFYTPPNTIVFTTVFSKFDASNAAIYGTCIALIVVWAIAIIFLRREDKKDQERWSTFFLCDSDASDEYFYLITVHTGLRRGAGTKSRVNFVLSGDDDDSGVRVLDDGIRKGFPSGSVRSFFMGTKYPLGDLTYLRLWHDNSGDGSEQSWYLNKVIIDDPQRHRRYIFLCDRWLALEQDDGQVERILPVCGRENLVNFNTLFHQHAQFNITENHLWLSLLIRPQRSSFTRVQRASCILALLFLTMISNAMFFRSSSDDVSPDQVQLGMLRFSMSILFISFIGIAITTPPILLVTIIFKKCKPKPVNNKHVLLKDKMKTQTLSSITKEQQKLLESDEFYSTDHLPLPYWTAYIAWIILFLAVVASAFFLILYSMQWGKPKSEEWLSSFVFSFMESLVCVDPLKVVLIAVLFAVIFRRPVDGNSPNINVQKLHDASQTFNAGSTRTYMTLWNDVISKNRESNKEELERLRKRRHQELQAMDALMNLIVYVVFVFIVYSISYINRDQRSFILKDNVDNHLNLHTKSQLGFSSVSGRQVWTNWMKNTFIPAYYPQKDYRGVALGTLDKQWFDDMSNVRVGPARLKQVRMQKDKCMYTRLTWPYPCVDPYTMYEEDQDDYCLKWTKYNASVCGTPAFARAYFTGNAWKYTKAEDIWGVPITGQYGMYGGGGYLLKFTKDRAQALSLLDELMANDWIDRGTRAVFVEFTLYNANTNLFVFAQFLAEFTELGGAFSWIESQSFRPVVTIGGLGTFSILCYFIFCLHLLVTTIKTITKMKQLGCLGFVRVPWNVVDSVCVILSYGLIIMFGFRMSYANQAMKMYYDDKLTGENVYINFQHIVIWDNVFNVVLAVLVFTATIRILRILGYNKRFSEVATVISNASGELLGFGVVFGIIYTAYICLGSLLFGNSLREYRSFLATWGSLTNALIGKNSLKNLIAVAPQMAQFYYFTYVFCVLMTLATMFAAILNKSISEVRAESAKEPETFGITNLLTKSFYDLFGLSSKKENVTSDKRKKKYTPIPGKSNFDVPNILRLVRETFGEYGEEENPGEMKEKRMKLSDQDLLLNRANTTLSRVDTPRDIQLLIDDEGRRSQQFPHYL